MKKSKTVSPPDKALLRPLDGTLSAALDANPNWQNFKSEQEPRNTPAEEGALAVSAPFVIVDDAAQSEPVPETLPYEPVLTDAPFPLPVETITTGPRALYRKVPGTNVSRADAVAYARKNWPFGALGKPPTAGIEFVENSIRHTMAWDVVEQEATK